MDVQALGEALRAGRHDATADEAGSLLLAARARVARQRRVVLAAAAVLVLGVLGGGAVALTSSGPVAQQQIAQQPEPRVPAETTDLVVRHVTVTVVPCCDTGRQLVEDSWTDLRSGAAVTTTTQTRPGTSPTVTVAVLRAGETPPDGEPGMGRSDLEGLLRAHRGPVDPAGVAMFEQSQHLVRTHSMSPAGCAVLESPVSAGTLLGGSQHVDICVDPRTDQPLRSVVEFAYPGDASTTSTDVELLPGTPENLARTVGPSPSPSGTGAPASSGPPAVSPSSVNASPAARPSLPACRDGDFRWTLTTDASTYAAGQDVHISMVWVYEGPACSGITPDDVIPATAARGAGSPDPGPGGGNVVLPSGLRAVGCLGEAAASYVARRVEPGTRGGLDRVWHQYVSAGDPCAGAYDPAPAGDYTVDDDHGHTLQITLDPR